MAAVAPTSTYPRSRHRRAAVVITGAVAGIAGLGGLATDTDSAWYRDLKLPSWQPPGAAFGPVWTVLYVLLARSAYLAWRDLSGSRRTPVLGLYALSGALNLAWTILFFARTARCSRPSRSWCSSPRSSPSSSSCVRYPDRRLGHSSPTHSGSRSPQP